MGDDYQLEVEDEQNEGLEVSCVLIYWWKELRYCSEHCNRECINKLIPIDNLRQTKFLFVFLDFGTFNALVKRKASVCAQHQLF